MELTVRLILLIIQMKGRSGPSDPKWTVLEVVVDLISDGLNDKL